MIYRIYYQLSVFLHDHIQSVDLIAQYVDRCIQLYLLVVHLEG